MLCRPWQRPAPSLPVATNSLTSSKRPDGSGLCPPLPCCGHRGLLCSSNAPGSMSVPVSASEPAVPFPWNSLSPDFHWLAPFHQEDFNLKATFSVHAVLKYHHMPRPLSTTGTIVGVCLLFGLPPLSLFSTKSVETSFVLFSAANRLDTLILCVTCLLVEQAIDAQAQCLAPVYPA